MLNILPIYVFIIALCFLVSLSVYFSPQKNSFLRYFPPFLFLTLLAETIGQYMRSVDENNVALYNFFSTFEFCFYLWMISLVVQKTAARTFIRAMAGIYLLAAVINIIFIQGMQRFHTVTYCLGCLLVVSVCVYYFLELFRFPRPISLLRNPAFWICTGLLFFYCCSFPLFGFINFWFNIPKFTISVFETIVNILNIFLYTLFMIAFLCVRTRKYTLSPS